MMRVWQALAEQVARQGVTAAFGLMGHGNLSMVGHLVRSFGIAYYGARHETGAVAMADAFARVTGGVGFCTVTHGPGLTNSLTGLAEAQKAHTALVLFAGDTPTGAFAHNQDIDQTAVLSSLGIAVERFRGSGAAVEGLDRAFHRARVERRPVVYAVPTDAQHEEVGAPEASFTPVARAFPRNRPDERAVAYVVDLIASAERPLVLAGRGAVLAGAGPQLQALGERIGAVLATTAQANGLFTGDPLSIGVAGGLATARARELIEAADLVLAFGASLNAWTTGQGRLISPTATIVQCDTDEAALGRHLPIHGGVLGDAAATAEAVLGALERLGFRGHGFRPLHGERRAHREETEVTPDTGTSGHVHPREVLSVLDRVLPRERTIVIDSGNFMGYPVVTLSVPDPAGFVFAQAFMSVGLGVPGGIGAAVARPDRLPVVVVGDGGLLMSLGELDVAVQHHLALLVCVMNDASYGAEVDELERLGLPTQPARLRDVDFAGVARGLGAAGLTVRSLNDCEGVGEWLADRDGPLVVDCKLDPTVRAEYWDD